MLDGDYTERLQAHTGKHTSAAAKAFIPSANANKEVILGVLKQYIPVGVPGLQVLTMHENGGAHVSTFAMAYPQVHFHPTHNSKEMLTSINAYSEGIANVQPGRVLDARQEDWHMTCKVDAVLAFNMVQSGPWEYTLGLMAGAAKYLTTGGHLFIYGPFKENGQYNSETDEAYDMSLHMRNPTWGYRDLADVVGAAAAQGLQLVAIHNMPMNNFMLVIESPAPQ